MAKTPVHLTANEALLKAASFCAYQERSHKEVREKLAELGFWGLAAEEILANLIAQNYLNEERFAMAFAGGKFRVKQWGKLRIVRELKLREVSDYCINKALKEIEEEDYRQTLKEVLQKRLLQTKKLKPAIAAQKAYTYALSRGFEPSLIWEILAELKGE